MSFEEVKLFRIIIDYRCCLGRTPFLEYLRYFMEMIGSSDCGKFNDCTFAHFYNVDL